MRQLFTGLLVATIIIAVPMLAVAGDREVAQRIAGKLESSGQLKGYEIAVKCEDGTVLLKGHVTNEQQAIAALKLALGTPGVERVVNELSTVSEEAPTAKTKESTAKPSATKPATTPEPDLSNAKEVPIQADKVPASFTRESVRPVSAFDQGEQESPLLGAQLLPRTDTQPATQRPLPLDSPPATKRSVSLAYKQTAVPASPPPVASAPPQSTGTPGPPLPMYAPGVGGGVTPARFDQPCLPNYAWPSYASHPNYAAVTYPKQYSPTAWPYIGPFYPYPQVPLGWRKVTLEWEDGWWMLDFKDTPSVWDPPIGRWY